MANPFFDPGSQRAEKVHHLFARIAPRYDLLNDLQSLGLHRCWKRRLIRLAQPAQGVRALDLCCGTGDLALALADCGAQVVGLDFSQEMLEVARFRQAKHQSAGQSASATPVQFLQADALQMPFKDNSFEIVTMAYGLRNLADFRAGLREMHRVAQPGGRLLVLDFGKPDFPLWRGIYFTYLRLFVPVLGLLFAGSAGAYGYILESLKHYPGQHGVAAYMGELGLINVRIINLLGGTMTINYSEKKRT